MKTILPRKQKGAVAIEFALVLVIFFLPGIGPIPNLPTTLTASSSLQF